MKRLPLFAVVAVCSALVGLSGVGAWAFPVAPKPKAPDAHHAMYAACAKTCAECMVECGLAAHHCSGLVAAGKADHLKPMQLAAACAEFCAASAKLTACHSDLAPTACEACAKACDMCGTACAKYADMPEMKSCTESCLRCAASCREMAKMTGAHGH